MGWLKDIHDIIRTYLPKPISFDVFMESWRDGYLIYLTNTSERTVHIKDIQINNVDINTLYRVIGMEIDTDFPLHSNQKRTLKIYTDKDDKKPKTIQFFIKSKFGRNKKLEYYI